MSRIPEIQEQSFSFIGKGSSLNGVFQLSGPTRMAGSIEGELTIHGKHDLVIEKDGSFRGTLKCSTIEIYGIFQGSLESSGSVVIYPSAQVTGDINSEHLVVHPGAVINMEGKTNADESRP